MEKYYTTPMEIALYSTPGVANIRSTSFYGLTFIRVTFKWDVDYYFAYTQAALALQQNAQLPQNQVPQIQQSSLVGEVYRYQLVGPKNFGLTNLRTVQDWVVERRLMTIPGVAQVNSWGGTTKNSRSRSIPPGCRAITSPFRRSSPPWATPTSTSAAGRSTSASSRSTFEAWA
jgi:cobalt-zinc-cadmium resistance protein CzcA